jgi:hypothetical protein
VEWALKLGVCVGVLCVECRSWSSDALRDCVDEHGMSIFASLLQRLRAGQCHTYTFAHRDTMLDDDNARWVVVSERAQQQNHQPCKHGYTNSYTTLKVARLVYRVSIALPRHLMEQAIFLQPRRRPYQ